VSEDELLGLVAAECDRLGLWWWHDMHPVRNKPGLPDLIIVGSKVLFAELKSAGSGPTPEQTRVGWRLLAAGASYALWYPADWRDGTIGSELEEMA
jgi:hypothetical protein